MADLGVQDAKAILKNMADGQKMSVVELEDELLNIIRNKEQTVEEYICEMAKGIDISRK